jgi:hypothetical protein
MKRFPRLFKVLSASLVLGLVLAIGGCPPPPPPGRPPQTVDKYDRAWSAVLGALADEQVMILQQDPAAGSVRGSLGDASVTANVARQADGGVRVEFGVSGNLAAHPNLKERIAGSYNRRMGR